MRHLKSVHPEAVSQEIEEESERKKRKADEAELEIWNVRSKQARSDMLQQTMPGSGKTTVVALTLLNEA